MSGFLVWYSADHVKLMDGQFTSSEIETQPGIERPEGENPSQCQSYMSAYLKFGSVSPLECWSFFDAFMKVSPNNLLSQSGMYGLLLKEFYANVSYIYPALFKREDYNTSQEKVQGIPCPVKSSASSGIQMSVFPNSICSLNAHEM